MTLGSDFAAKGEARSASEYTHTFLSQLLIYIHMHIIAMTLGSDFAAKGEARSAFEYTHTLSSRLPIYIHMHIIAMALGLDLGEVRSASEYMRSHSNHSTHAYAQKRIHAYRDHDLGTRLCSARCAIHSGIMITFMHCLMYL